MTQPKIPAIKCKQWLADWNSYEFTAESFRRKPSEDLYVFSMSARLLRKLSGVFKRQRTGSDATGIQRVHVKERSLKISDYVKTGYPFCDLTAKQRQDVTNSSLKKPGWLPTAIVVNFLTEFDERRSQKVSAEDIVKIENGDGRSDVVLPSGIYADWTPTQLPPIEIIDGQHRLFAFDGSTELPDDFELPVVAFQGLDIGWQAYLFWSINVSPKKINPSHAYDLFPLLRTQDWLEIVSSVNIYREARAQELTELLYRHESSPWNGRINMLGERKLGSVSQATWVKAIFGTFLSPGGSSVKGLFATNISQTTGPLDWSRPQQAAFLIFIWRLIQSAVSTKKTGWALSLRDRPDLGDHGDIDLAFQGANTLLNQDQGVRGLCRVWNDLLFIDCQRLLLNEWRTEDIEIGETRNIDIEKCLNELDSQPFTAELEQLANICAEYDWRSSSAPDLSIEESKKKAAFRGGGGYGLMRSELLQLIAGTSTKFGNAAKNILTSEKS